MAESVNTGEEKPKKKMNLKGVIILVVLAVLAGGIGIGASIFLGVFGSHEAAEASDGHGAEGDGHAETKPDAPGTKPEGAKPDAAKPKEEPKTDVSGLPFTTINLPEMLVNLSPRANARFMKLNLALSVREDKAREFGMSEAKVTDALQDYLRLLDENDLSGNAGMLRFRMELLKRARAILGREAVADVFILQFIIQ
jgi:flagellar basal body-associated protein FliL